MSPLALVLLLLAVAVALLVLARCIRVAHPVLLVCGGLVLACLPDLPRVTLDPATLFLAFVPPLLYRAAATASLRDLRRHATPILHLAVPLVLASIAAVAVVAHAMDPSFTWAAAFVLGAVLSAPDPVVSVAVLRSLRMPAHVVRVLEGEGLVNDATALTAYRLAMGAVVTATFSPWDAVVRFVAGSVGGVAVGLAVGWATVAARRRIADLPVAVNTVSLLTPFLAYLSADGAGVSGVLSVVTAGLYVGRAEPHVTSPTTRLQGDGLWTVLVFVLESLVFIFIGLELPAALAALHERPPLWLAWAATAVFGTLLVVRVAWLLAASGVRRLAQPRSACASPTSWRELAVLSWAGVRGADSLVIALALPHTVAGGVPFPARDLILFLTFAVICATVILQGGTLPLLVRHAALGDDGRTQRELERARRVLRRVPRAVTGASLDAIMRQHAALVALRDRGRIGDDVLATMERELDMRATLLASRQARASHRRSGRTR